MILRPNSRSCRTASIRSGIAGGLAGQLATTGAITTIKHHSSNEENDVRRGWNNVDDDDLVADEELIEAPPFRLDDGAPYNADVRLILQLASPVQSLALACR